MDFKFQVGQVVRFVGSPNYLFQILERRSNQCTGGVQFYYLGRVHAVDNSRWLNIKDGAQYGPSRELDQYHEIELEALA